jgi:hypothetical protein
MSNLKFDFENDNEYSSIMLIGEPYKGKKQVSRQIIKECFPEKHKIQQSIDNCDYCKRPQMKSCYKCKYIWK